MAAYAIAAPVICTCLPVIIYVIVVIVCTQSCFIQQGCAFRGVKHIARDCRKLTAPIKQFDLKKKNEVGS
jgi:hypothetical protein